MMKKAIVAFLVFTTNIAVIGMENDNEIELSVITIPMPAVTELLESSQSKKSHIDHLRVPEVSQRLAEERGEGAFHRELLNSTKLNSSSMTKFVKKILERRNSSPALLGKSSLSKE